MLNFKIKPLDNITFNFQELVDYYQELKNNYQYLKWVPNPELGYKDVYSWAIQTNLENNNIAAAPYNLPGEWLGIEQRKINNTKFNTPTKLIFGFAEKVLNMFPSAKHCVIITHGPGFIIPPHIDDSEGQDEDHIKIHVPIESNDQSYFEFGEEQYVMTTGKFYLVNTMLEHSTINLGLTERSHLIFKIPLAEINKIIDDKIVI